jgi:chemotaxis family two-component system sensor histidine kinase/response regulator PixL
MLAFDPEIRDQAYQFFTQEALEFLQTLEDGLLTLHQDHSVAKVHTLMRAAHSIKGGAASVGLPVIQKLAHQLEDAMRALYREELEIDFTLEEILLQAYDCLRIPLIEQIQTGYHDETIALQQAEPIFARLTEQLGDALHNLDHFLPSSSDVGIDIVQAIFTGDIQDGIQRLSSVLAVPAEYEIVGEIRTQAEVFAGVGELVNLPGFAAIAKATLIALQYHPDQALEIGKVALADFQAAQAAVLAGDRREGGQLSQKLVDLSQPSYKAGSEIVTSFSIEENLIEEVPIEKSLIGSDLEEYSIFSTSVNHQQSDESNDIQSTYVTHSIRVDLNRLERLNNLVAELVTEENGSVLQHNQLQGIVNRIVHRFTYFESISRKLEHWSDRHQNTRVRLQTSQLEYPVVLSSIGGQETLLSPIFSPVEFDPLQLDFYSDVYTIVQEIVEEIAQVGEAMRDMSLIMQQAQQLQRRKQQTLKQIRNDLLWARMLPISDVLQRFPRMVRDLSVLHDKQVTIKLVGTTTRIDKVILEKLYDPLVHLVRNAFDHGVELPAVRQTQGKPPQATIEIRAYHRGNQTYLEVSDDGQGIDIEVVRARAIALNLVSTSEGATLSREQLYELLFLPGFSTTDRVSDLSGRGVGLDTVRSQVKQLKGSISITSEPGQGTTFTLRLPLTLTIAKLLIFTINSHVMAIPIDTLVEIRAVSSDQVQIIQGKQFIQWEEGLIPIYSSSIFSHNYLLIKPTSEQIQGMSLPSNGKIPLLLIAGESQVVALQIDQIVQEQELAIKPFGQAVPPPSYLYGCTILGDGSLVPVIDGQVLITHIQTMTPSRQATRSPFGEKISDLSITPEADSDRHAVTPSMIPSTPTILVVDDSLTTRQTLALTLKKAGYRVVQARDGREALEQLQHNTDICAVFSDLEMPQMNGFEFLSYCRQKFAKSELPVIMLSSRSSEKHRQVATLMGATHYLTKPYLEQELLQILRHYLA